MCVCVYLSAYAYIFFLTVLPVALSTYFSASTPALVCLSMCLPACRSDRLTARILPVCPFVFLPTCLHPHVSPEQFLPSLLYPNIISLSVLLLRSFQRSLSQPPPSPLPASPLVTLGRMKLTHIEMSVTCRSGGSTFLVRSWLPWLISRESSWQNHYHYGRYHDAL